jgi:hypothetical protein
MASFSLARTDGEGNTLTYNTDNFVRVTMDLATPLSPMAIPMQPSNKTILIKTDGNTTIVNISWKIRELSQSSETASLGFTGTVSAREGATMGNPPTATPSTNDILTPIQVIHFWDKFFSALTPEDVFVLTIGGIEPMTGIIQQVSFSTSQQSPAVWEGNIRFVKGFVAAGNQEDLQEVQIGSITNSNVDVNGQSTSDPKIEISNIQTVYDPLALGITGYVVRFKLASATTWTTATNSTTPSNTNGEVVPSNSWTYANSQDLFLNVSANGTYDVKVSSKVSTGANQQESPVQQVTVS